MQGLCAVGNGEAISRDLKAFISGAIMQIWQHPSSCQSGSSELPWANAIKCPFPSPHFIIPALSHKGHGPPLPALPFLPQPPACPVLPETPLHQNPRQSTPSMRVHVQSHTSTHPWHRAEGWLGQGHSVPTISPLSFAACKDKAQGGCKYGHIW